MLGVVIEATDATFEQDVIERSREIPVVVDFWAPWCAPCKEVGKILTSLAEAAEGAWVLVKIDIDSGPEVASTLAVTTIPTIRVFRAGERVGELIGAHAEIAGWIHQLLSGPSERTERS